jgi:hypothetical protein
MSLVSSALILSQTLRSIAPKSGCPTSAIKEGSKSATADFDCDASRKDGGLPGRAAAIRAGMSGMGSCKTHRRVEAASVGFAALNRSKPIAGTDPLRDGRPKGSPQRMRSASIVRTRSIAVGPQSALRPLKGDCRSVDELTGGRFAVTIIRGLSGGGSRCGRHQLVVARRRCLRSVRPLARGRSAFYVLLKRHRSERGRPARGVVACAISMAGVA